MSDFWAALVLTIPLIAIIVCFVVFFLSEREDELEEKKLRLKKETI